MRAIIDIAKALSDPGRIRILLALKGQPLCVCQLTELLELAPSTVSKHMALLRQARLVDSRKQGRWICYHRPGPDAAPRIQAVLQWLDTYLDERDRLEEDARRLREILARPLEESCGPH